MNFAHLHVHSHYSLLHSTIKIPALVEAVTGQDQVAVALTDHSNMFGAVEFFKAARKKGVKPIMGCEVLVESLDPDVSQEQRVYGLVLLAENNEGYQELLRLVSCGWRSRLDRKDRRPVVTREHLDGGTKGLIALSGGLSGEIQQSLLKGDKGRANRVVESLKGYFPGSFYLEIQPGVLAEHHAVRPMLKELGDETGLQLVVGCNTHYIDRGDASAHRALMCIQMNKSIQGLSDDVVDGFHLWTPEELQEEFKGYEDALSRTVEVADRCNVEINLEETFLPQFVIPEQFGDQDDYLRFISAEGLADRIKALTEMGIDLDKKEYDDRLKIELDIIAKMGFPGYFLIVWDFINWAKQNDVPVGPGRGSGAGSLVAYALGITDIDPMQYDLLFERFLNPERVSMPDFDIDFCMNTRDRVIHYVTEKYGSENVGQIVTYGSLKAKGVIRDVARVMDLPYSEADRVAKLVPDVLNITLGEALDQEPRLKSLAEQDEQVGKLLDIALSLENLYRHTGVHAAGIVIAEDELWNYVPIITGEDGELITQFAKNEVEEAGLVKFDFLGLKTLTVIDEAVKVIRTLQAQDERAFDISRIPMDDGKVFKLLQSGNTTGVFQLESSGFKDLMKRLKPDKFEDIIAAVALYRPGPLQSGMVDSFIRRKHGSEAVDYLHPSLEGILEETYGTIIYQEQVMRLASVLAGFSLGQADLLRRAMGKKKADVMAQQREVFVEGAIANEVKEETAAHIFDLVQEFASYGFNKSHSAAYGLISYQTAYLKAHYPVAFMAALLTCDRDNTDKVVRYIHEARSMGIQILPPDVNESALDFSVANGAIRFGLGAVKNVGQGAILSIIEAREKEGDFSSLMNFCERVDLRKVNRRVLEGLVKCGAFDAFGAPRDLLFANVERAMDRGQAMQRDRDVGQFSLFGAFDSSDPKQESDQGDLEPIDEHAEWTERMELRFERESLGFYITGHPLDRYIDDLPRLSTGDTSRLMDFVGQSEMSFGAVVVGIRERPLRDGSGRMAFLQLEDHMGQMEAVCFSKAYMQYEAVIKSDDPILVKGNVRLDGDGENKVAKFRISGVSSLAEVRRQNTRMLRLQLRDSQDLEQFIPSIQRVLSRHPGHCETQLELAVADDATAVVNCGSYWRIDPCDELLGRLERIVGKGSAHFC